jgi:hypothetical protein
MVIKHVVTAQLFELQAFLSLHQQLSTAHTWQKHGRVSVGIQHCHHPLAGDTKILESPI